MYDVINGKPYDTETSFYIGFWSNGLPVNDYAFVRKSLFKKRRSGEYFLYCEGGGATEYGIKKNGRYLKGEKIEPLTNAQASAFAQEFLSDYEVKLMNYKYNSRN